MRQPLAGSTMAPSTMFVTPKSVAEANRQEQLAKWETSETNRVPSMRRPIKDSKVQFTEADVFLSACLSGDLEEVQTLLDNGADINTCTVDGLTALHQAVIDGKPEMVQFLCDHGADLNAQDNEGWTPLHAAACCGNLDLVEYLCMEGADISVTNSDKELAVDLAEEDDCRIALEEEHRRRNVDPDECRNREMMIMRRDAEEWLRDGEYRDRPHSRTGASALHVAAAKGYTDVMRIQLRAGADVNCRDRDGWTPLHAAAHWGEREAATLLVNNGASFNELTNNGESVLNVADKDVVEFLEALQEKERTKQASSNSVNVLMQTNTTLKRAGSVSSVLRMSTEEKLKKTKLDEQDENKDLREGKYSLIIEEKSPSPSVECCLPYPVAARESSETPTEQERSSKSSSTSSEERSSSTSTSESKSDSAKWPEAGAKKDVLTERVSAKVSLIPQRPDVLSRPEVSSRLDGSSRLENAMVSGSPARPNVFPQSKHQVDRSSSERSSDSSTNNAQQPHARNIASPEVVSSRTPSTDSTSSSVLISRPGWTHDGKRVFPIQKESSLSTASPPESPLLKKSSSVQRTGSIQSTLPWMALYRSSSSTQAPTNPAFMHFQSVVRQASASGRPAAVPPLALASGGTPSIPVSKVPPPPVSSAAAPTQQTRGSFVTPTPPTEPNMPKESEAERRSKAKRQRDSRRSTQGVTREQLRAATASVLREGKENDSNWSGAVTRDLSSTPSQESTPPSDSQSNAAIERKSVASSEQDTRADVAAPSQTSKDIANVRRRSQAPRSTRRGTGPISLEEVQSALDAMTMQKDGESPVATPSCSASSSLAGFTATTSSESSSNPLNSAITRVTISGKERPLFSSQTTTSYTNAHPSRFITTSAMPPRSATQINNLVKGISANSETSPNYKEMYEKERQENERLRRMLEEAQEKSAQNANGVNGVMGRVVGRLGSPALTKSTSTSSIDDNERRSYERRIAELEYEIKQLEHVRTDNQKLKEENGALIRVISKLSK
uniref:Protein phosphatase 1 regulatory subunit 12A n=1 Tax=Ascaris suum TaxID=6253 RepID=F1KQT9_ASCSU